MVRGLPALPICNLHLQFAIFNRRPLGRRCGTGLAPVVARSPDQATGMDRRSPHRFLTPKASHNKAQGRGARRAPWVTKNRPPIP